MGEQVIDFRYRLTWDPDDGCWLQHKENGDRIDFDIVNKVPVIIGANMDRTTIGQAMGVIMADDRLRNDFFEEVWQKVSGDSEIQDMVDSLKRAVKKDDTEQQKPEVSNLEEKKSVETEALKPEPVQRIVIDVNVNNPSSKDKNEDTMLELIADHSDDENDTEQQRKAKLKKMSKSQKKKDKAKRKQVADGGLQGIHEPEKVQDANATVVVPDSYDEENTPIIYGNSADGSDNLKQLASEMLKFKERKEKKQKEEEFYHSLTHQPAEKDCDFCMKAKIHKAPAQKVPEGEQRKAANFFGCCTDGFHRSCITP